jgi:hypothetical protein
MFRMLLHESSGAQLHLSGIGVCNGFGMLIHWSRYWLGHPYTFSTVIPNQYQNHYTQLRLKAAIVLLTLDTGEMSSSRYAWGKSRIYWTGGWVGPKAILYVFGEAKILLHHLGIKPQFLGWPCRGLVAILLTLSWLHIQGTGGILQLCVHCVYLVFVYLLLVPFFPHLWHTTLVLHEFEDERVGVFE